MNVKRTAVTVGTVATAALALGAGATAAMALGAGAASADSVPGCGEGLALVYGPLLEQAVSDATSGNVNGDGYVCVQRKPRDIGGQGFISVIDDRVRK
jgi:hypothetical protein